MAHVVEIDQSFKFENTQKDTIIAFANGITYSICIPASVKRECIRELRIKGFYGPKMYIKIFAICLFLLLKKKISKINHIIIDKEYTGREGQIKDSLINLFRRAEYTISYDQIIFNLVGKKSNAHITALKTLRKERKPDQIITVKDILEEFLVTKKIGA